MDKKHNVCVRMPKIYDWVRSRVKLPTISFDTLNFNGDNDSECVPFPQHQDPCKILKKQKAIVECLLTDREGNSLNPKQKDSFFCSIKIEDGPKPALKKAIVVVQGFIVIQILNSFGFVICESNPIPFRALKTFIICAPEGTEATCEVTFFKCESELICSENYCFKQLDILIVLCIDVLSTANVKLDIEAKPCKIRDDIPVEEVECPIDHIPSQCPTIF